MLVIFVTTSDMEKEMNEETMKVVTNLIALAKEIEKSSGRKKRELRIQRQNYIKSINGKTSKGESC